MSTRHERGFTAIEALVALALTTAVLSTLLLLTQPVLDTVARVPEATDLHDRGRAAEGILRHVLEPAGSGPDLVLDAPLSDLIPAIWPRRLGRWSADVDGSAWSDRLTVVSVPFLAPQAPLATPLGAGATTLPLTAHHACGVRADCGFAPGDHVALLDDRGTVAFTRADTVTGAVVHPDLPLPVAVNSPAIAALVEMSVIYFDAARRQLRRYDGFANDQPLVDDVVWMAVRYYVDPVPPRRPQVPGEPTCVVDAGGMALLPLLGPVPAPLVELPPAALSDGPWCGTSPWSFDADLLRLRAVRVALRLQAASILTRGAGSLFLHPGTASRPAQEVADLPLDVFVTPRVLGGGA